MDRLVALGNALVPQIAEWIGRRIIAYEAGMNETSNCIACGKPLGTGTLLDFQPEPPPATVAIGMTQPAWQAFARRYLCPICGAFKQADSPPSFE